MSRARNLKPSFFLNEHLAELPPLARLLYQGLWTMADRDGRLEDRPKRIKASILPYDDCDVDKALAAIARAGFIIRYKVEGQGYIQVQNWHKHQHPHIKEVESIIPAPDLTSASMVQEPDEPPAISPPSLNPHPLTLNPQLGDAAKMQPSPTDLELFFDRFWEIYPARKGRKAGPKETVRDAYGKLPKYEWEAMIGYASNYAKYCEEADQYPVDPIRFIRNGFYKDYRQPIVVPQGGNNGANKANGYGPAKQEGAARAGVILDHDTIRENAKRREEALARRLARPEGSAPS